MKFSVYQPPQAKAGRVPVLYYLAGLTCTEETFPIKAHAQAVAAGTKFDPHQHQAITEVPGTDVAAGGIVEVMQPGYELLGRLVRPAMVVVAAKEGPVQPEGSKPNGAGGNPYAGGDDADPGGSVDRRA